MFKKFNKIAVLVCGELRQHWRAAPSHFEYFNHFSDTVDYFLVTWDTTKDLQLSQTQTNQTVQVAESQITDVFKNQNLKELRIISKEEFEDSQIKQSLISKGLMSNFYYRAYLAKTACELKNHHEKIYGKQYDLVAEIRPDLWMRSRLFYESAATTPLVPLADWQIIAPVPWLIYKIPNAAEDTNISTQVPAMDDLYFISNSKVNNILADRLNFLKHVRPYNDHRLMHIYLELNNIYIVRDIYHTVTEVIRPNVPTNFDFDIRSPAEIESELQKYNDFWKNR